MDAEAVVRAGPRTLHILGTVRGLASEAARVEAAIDRLAPRALALGIGPEDLDGLHQVEQGVAYEHEYSEADEVYAHFLEQFGPVELPPRELVAAVRRARAEGIPLVALDLPEVAYVEAFTQKISAWQLLRYNRRIRKLARGPPDVPDAMAFHLWWDRQVTALSGFAALERQRERAMAATLRDSSLPEGTILVLVEAARVAGLVEALQQPAEGPAAARSRPPR